MRFLLAEWPSSLGYAISFVTIGTTWVDHHHVFRHIHRSDHRLLLLDPVLLMRIAFLPFPTAVLAEYLPRLAGRTAATVFYGATLTGIALAFNALWRYAAHGRNLLHVAVDARLIRAMSREPLVGAMPYAAATAIGFVSVPASLILFGVLALLSAVPTRTRP